MIKFSLNCKCGNIFDSWFSSSSEFERLKGKKYLTCPICNSSKITKSLMSPNLNKKSNTRILNNTSEQKVRNKLVEFKKFVEKNCKNVGNKFAQEARKIHYSKKGSKGIYGNATKEETRDLIDEGIEISTIPWIDNDKNN